MTTIQNRLAAALIARGEREMPFHSGKYRRFTRAEGGFWYLGKAGALRYGKTATDSFVALQSTRDAVVKPPRLRAADCGAPYGMPIAAKVLTNG